MGLTVGLTVGLILSVVDDGEGMLKEGGRGRIFMDVVVPHDSEVNGNRLRSVAIRSGRNLTWQSMKPFRAQHVLLELL